MEDENLMSGVRSIVYSDYPYEHSIYLIMCLLGPPLPEPEERQLYLPFVL